MLSVLLFIGIAWLLLSFAWFVGNSGIRLRFQIMHDMLAIAVLVALSVRVPIVRATFIFAGERPGLIAWCTALVIIGAAIAAMGTTAGNASSQ